MNSNAAKHYHVGLLTRLRLTLFHCLRITTAEGYWAAIGITFSVGVCVILPASIILALAWTSSVAVAILVIVISSLTLLSLFAAVSTPIMNYYERYLLNTVHQLEQARNPHEDMPLYTLEDKYDYRESSTADWLFLPLPLSRKILLVGAHYHLEEAYACSLPDESLTIITALHR